MAKGLSQALKALPPEERDELLLLAGYVKVGEEKAGEGSSIGVGVNAAQVRANVEFRENAEAGAHAESVVNAEAGEKAAAGENTESVANAKAKENTDVEENTEVGENAADQAKTPPIKAFALTDLGNAERFVYQHSANVRYCALTRCWSIWNGRYWEEDVTEQIYHLACGTIRDIPREAELYSVDGSRRAKVLKWATQSEARERVRAMVELAQPAPEVAIRPDLFNQDPWLLTCRSGTLNLKTGELQPHQRQDYISKLAPVEYDPQATCPTWERFLDCIFAQRTSLIDYVQKICGYCLTGNTDEHDFYFLYGNGANGKSTLIKTLMALLGNDYARQASSSALTARCTDSIGEDIAVLQGARLVAAVELDEGRKLAEGLLKQLTGGDLVRARMLYANSFEFLPTFKLLLASNHKPTITGTDNGIWRRIKLIPFTVAVPEAQQDPQLFGKLQAELPGILNWCLAGCLKWQQEGLDTPAEVKGATSGYREDSDLIGAFLEENVSLKSPDARIQVKVLYENYQRWMESAGERTLSMRRFNDRLKERGYQSVAGTGNLKFWQGIGLLIEPADWSDISRAIELD